jgi:hypothetical protein
MELENPEGSLSGIGTVSGHDRLDAGHTVKDSESQGLSCGTSGLPDKFKITEGHLR